jgi:hypothetical protein
VAKGEGMDKLTYEEQEKALNFYALDFEEFLRENFQPGTMSMEHALNMLSWPAFEPVVVPCNSRTR